MESVRSSLSPEPPSATPALPRHANTRLHGPYLLLTRVTWVAIAVLTVICIVVSIPVEFARLQTVCMTGACEVGALSPANVRELGAMGLSVGFFAAMRAGAHGYVLKGADGTETLRAIRAAASGEAIFSPTITRRLTEYFATPGRDPSTSSVQAFPSLTEREHEILSLMADGYTNTAIASRLYLSPKTVRNYVSSIFTKLEVSDRSQAIVQAREAGLGMKGDLP
jgi:DNA-binding CsgD family transcriptional regulator